MLHFRVTTPAARLSTPPPWRRGLRGFTPPVTWPQPHVSASGPRAAVRAQTTEVPAGTGGEMEVLVCTHQTCRKAQGSHQTLMYFKDLAPVGVAVSSCGCLGKCGNGPNVAVGGSVFRHVGTASQAAAILHSQCRGAEPAAALEAMELKVRGNASFEGGDLAGAEQLYSRAIELNPTAPAYSNRSSLRLAAGDAAAALEDALAAASAAPGWHKARLREADALCALGDPSAALGACEEALRLEPGLRKSGEFVQRVKKLKLLVAGG